MRQKQYQQPPPRRRRRPRPRRKRPFGLAGFSLSFIFILIVFFGASLFFRVHVIEVNGAVISSPTDIRNLSGISDGDFLFYINRRTAVRAILSDQSYVDTVDIKIRMPNIVYLNITECISIAYIKNDNDHWIIDRRGKLLEVTRSKPDLPEIIGLRLLVPLTGTSMEVGVESEYKVAPLLELLELLNEREIRAGTISYDTALGISFTYLNRFNVIVGLPELFEHKLDRLPVYIEQLEPNATGTIELPEEGGRVGRFVPD